MHIDEARRVRALAFALAFGVIAPDASAQSQVSCTSGPYRLTLPKSYKAVRGLGTLRRERVINTEQHGTHTVTHRELRFNGLELELATSSDKPNQYVLSKAIVSSRSWRIAGPLRVGSPASSALRGLRPKELPRDGEIEFNGATDSIRVVLAAGRILDFEYSCHSD